jgi:hypothetical protein
VFNSFSIINLKSREASSTEEPTIIPIVVSIFSPVTEFLPPRKIIRPHHFLPLQMLRCWEYLRKFLRLSLRIYESR